MTREQTYWMLALTGLGLALTWYLWSTRQRLKILSVDWYAGIVSYRSPVNKNQVETYQWPSDLQGGKRGPWTLDIQVDGEAVQDTTIFTLTRNKRVVERVRINFTDQSIKREP